MAIELQPGNNGAFFIDFGDGVSQPFQRGQLLPYLERNANQAATGRIALRDVVDINAPVVNYQIYSDYINGNTGLAFATLAEFIAFSIEYIYFRNDITGSTVAMHQTLYVVTVPVAADEVAPGATIAHDFLDSGTVQFVMRNGAWHGIPDLTHTPGSPGTLALDSGAFIDGDIVFISKNP